MKKSILVCFLIAIMLLSITACNDKPKTTPTPVPSATPTAQAEETYKSEYLKAGEKIRLFQWWNQAGKEPFPDDDIYSAHKRETVAKLEQENGIEIQFVVVQEADQWGTIRNAAAQGNPVADGMHGGGTPLIMDNYYVNDIPGSILANLSLYENVVSFKDPALFNQNAQDTLCTFQGQLYFFVPMQVGRTAVYMQQVCFFNYDLLKQIGVEPEEIYNAVKEKKWNWEMFADLATRVTDESKNVWGFTRGSGGSTIYNLITSNGAQVVGPRDVNGQMVDRLVMGEQNALKAWDFYVDLYQTKKCINPTDFGNDDTGVVREFVANRLAFMFTYLERANGLTDKDIGMQDGQFGIVPVPMGPNADRYYAETNWIEPYAMFKDAMNPEGTLFVMYKLYKPMYPAGSKEAEELFEVECSEWCADENAMEMIRLIRDSNIYTRHGIYSWTNGYEFLFSVLMADQPILEGSTTASAYIASIESKINDLIDRVNRLK